MNFPPQNARPGALAYKLIGKVEARREGYAAWRQNEESNHTRAPAYRSRKLFVTLTLGSSRSTARFRHMAYSLRHEVKRTVQDCQHPGAEYDVRSYLVILRQRSPCMK